MVLTNDVHLPTEEELTVPEVNLSSSALRAGAFHLGKYCEKQNLVSRYSTPINDVHFQIERFVVALETLIVSGYDLVSILDSRQFVVM